jgi:hypothetical protein
MFGTGDNLKYSSPSHNIRCWRARAVALRFEIEELPTAVLNGCLCCLLGVSFSCDLHTHDLWQHQAQRPIHRPLVKGKKLCMGTETLEKVGARGSSGPKASNYDPTGAVHASFKT